mgnify:CR=1 FL=1
MNTQPNKPSDFNSLSELYMKACEARFQLLQERSELVMENFELRMQRSKAERIINETYPIKLLHHEQRPNFTPE